MRIAFWAVVLVAGCGVAEDRSPQGMNRWADERLWPVLEAQEHRDTERLCGLLKDAAAEVREAAALAFASVQDTSGIPCLLNALGDAEARVRATAVFALGFVADSLTVERMAEAAMNERDTTVQRAYLNASFLAMQRRGMLRDPNAILHYMDRSTGHERVRAADALRRLPDSVLVAMEEDYLRLVEEEQDTEVKAMLVRGMGAFRSQGSQEAGKRWAAFDHPAELRVNALRALASMSGPSAMTTLVDALSDVSPVVRSTALEELERLSGRLSKHTLESAQVDDTDPMTYLRWYRLLAGSWESLDTPYLRHSPDPQNAPYAFALLIPVLHESPYQDKRHDISGFMSDARHPAIRQAALELLINSFGISDPLLFESFAGELTNEIFASGDPGLIARLCEALLGAEMGWYVDRVSLGPFEKAKVGLHPIRDLETLALLDQVIAKRDGLPPPSHRPPPFNHPIGKEKLRALPQGQRYRITTPKGEIVIATDVNEAPGSSLAFDSLVTAGYYNGKYFHRMVPNFVVQGGCPRGDGYGGMDWTLRTEIGRKPFTAGSVGLASAGRDTESCQFFITHSATPHLDGRYTRFGEVVEGMDVVWRLQVGDVMERVERVEYP